MALVERLGDRGRERGGREHRRPTAHLADRGRADDAAHREPVGEVARLPDVGDPGELAVLAVEGVVAPVLAAEAHQAAGQQVRRRAVVVVPVLVDPRRVEAPDELAGAQVDGEGVLADLDAVGAARPRAEEHEAVLDVDRGRAPHAGAAEAGARAGVRRSGPV